MIKRIEISFAIPVELTDAETQFLDRLVEQIARRHEPEGWCHWCAECGDKPSFSQADARFLGLEVDPLAPPMGEPSFDDSILTFSTFAREAYPEEIERKKATAARRKWRMQPWYKRWFTERPA